MKTGEKELKIFEIKSTKPGVWFKFKVLLNDIHVADFETQIDNGYNLDGERESVYTIYKIVVNSLYRRNKIGTQIIDYCEQLAVKKGLKKVLCLVKPLDKNISQQDLINFYRKNNMRFIKDEHTESLYAIKDLCQ